MKTVLVIGIGAGHPDHITIQAIEALRRVDVFFVLDKGPAKEALTAFRHELCRRHIPGRAYRVVEPRAPERDIAVVDYQAAVADLLDDKGRLFEQLIRDELRDGECGAFLVWGDPSLYDSTVRILTKRVDLPGLGAALEVIPGITSVQALAAQHRTTLNQVGQAFEVTTGRRLAEGFPAERRSAVVMLDANCTFRRYAEQDVDIFWGAYVGTSEEILVSGKLADVADEIVRLREAARAEHGWIMDSYILHRTEERNTGD